jgi:hypothetical protein
MDGTCLECNRFVRVGGNGQMDLGFNRKAEFTKWVVSAGLLTVDFVLIDVGVQGGESIR